MALRVRTLRIPVNYGKDFAQVTYRGYVEALHYSQSNPRLNGNYVGGGPFHMTRLTRDVCSGPGVTHRRNDVVWTGSLMPATRMPRDIPVVSASSSQSTIATSMGLDTYQNLANASVARGDYARGYARTRPGQPQAGLGQFIIELRDLPSVTGLALYRAGMLRSVPFRDIPGLIQHLVGKFRALGSEYLNLVFGWQPFVKDLQEIYHLSKSIDKQMAQIIRDNRKGIRRRTTLSSSTSTVPYTTSYQASFYGVTGPPSWTSGSGTVTSVTTTTEKIWYVAKYSYYIPDTNSWGWNARARAALFGVLPTPGLLWEVLPFSWMADWFGSVGDVLNNLSPNAVDNLVAHYAYVMRHLRVEHSVTASGSCVAFHNQYGNDIPATSYSVIARGMSESKSRFPAFAGLAFFPGGSPGPLSGRQTAILAALGLSRVPR